MAIARVVKVKARIWLNAHLLCMYSKYSGGGLDYVVRRIEAVRICTDKLKSILRITTDATAVCEFNRKIIQNQISKINALAVHLCGALETAHLLCCIIYRNPRI